MTMGTRDKLDDITGHEDDAWVYQRLAIECPEKITVPFDHGTNQFTHHHPGLRTEHIERLAQCIAHPQAADKDTGRLVTSQVPAAQPRQFQLRFILAAVHKVLTVDRYKKVTVMLI